MSLRRPYAAVLQLLRKSKGLHQHAIAGAVAQSHISLIESSKTTASVDVTEELANALQLDVTAFFGMVIAASQQRTPRDVLLSAIGELEGLGLADTLLPSEAQKLEPPRVAESRQKKSQIQDLKSKGRSRAQVARELNFSWTTVNRLWDNELTE
jgi:transcriptional regulator with XRE-family HTH domain